VIRRVVVVKFKPESTPDTIDEVVQELRELPLKVPVIREYEVGLDLNSGRPGDRRGVRGTRGPSRNTCSIRPIGQ
jgi:hypothetical protein